MTWKKDIFNNFIKLNRGFDLPEKDIVSGKFPVVASAAIKAYHHNYKVEPPCVVTGRSGSLGKVQYVTSRCWPLNTTLYVKDYKGNFPRFVHYFLETMHLENFNSGAGVPTLNQNHLHKLKITIPSLPEQKQIAAILSAYDDLIENNNRRITILEKMTEELYREWFVRLRFPGHEKVKIAKGVPEGWEVKQITQIYRTSSGGTPSREKSEYYGGSIPWVKTGELKNTFLIKTEEQITENALENSSAKIFPKHTIILAMYCAMGELSILSLDAATNQACCAFLPKYDYLSYPFSYHLIRNVRQSLINLSFGAAQQNLSQEIIKKFKILVPPKELINKFSEVVLPVFKTIENFYTQNDRLKIFRDRLLSRLMSGKIDVEDMDIQFPASMQEELVHA